MNGEPERDREALETLARRVAEDPRALRADDDHARQARILAQHVLDALDDAEGPTIARLLDELSGAVFVAGGQRALLEARLPFFAYDLLSDYELNAPTPWLPTPARDPGSAGWPILGRRVSNPFGVSASVLTVNASWVEFFARSGCDVVTYKTVRSRKRDAHPYPHWRILQDASGPFDVGQFPAAFQTNERHWPLDRSAFSTANSFGVPSEDPDLWQPDFADAKKALDEDQVIFLSVMGTDPDPTLSDQVALASDFASAARLAEEAGADIIELNLSCPNTIDEYGGVKTDLICQSPSATLEVVAAVREKLINDETKLIAKCSWIERPLAFSVLAPLLRDRLIDAVSGINTMQANVFTDGEPSFRSRQPAGVSGAAIRRHALDFVSSLEAIRQDVGAFDIIGIGGVLEPQHVHALLDAGADVVQSATGLLADHELGLKVRDYLAQNLKGGRIADAQRRAVTPPPDSMATGPLSRRSTSSGAGPLPLREVIGALDDGKSVAISRLRHSVGLSGGSFDAALAAAVANGLVAVKNRLGKEVQVQLTRTGRMVLEAP